MMFHHSKKNLSLLILQIMCVCHILNMNLYILMHIIYYIYTSTGVLYINNIISNMLVILFYNLIR